MQGTLKAPPATLTGRHKILLVDDHQIILDSLSMMMGTFNDIEVSGKINDPREVIHFLQNHPTDLLISDISMPHLDGLQLAELVRHHFPSIKILMLTVSESAEQVKEAVRIGVEGYILKKANKDELSRAVRTIMDGHRYFSQSLLSFI